MPEFLKLKKSNCKNCYKCIRSCPVKSIRFSANQAHIVGEECILCGQCFVVCPQNAKEIADGTEAVRVMLCADLPVYASVAPSFAAYFEGVGFERLSAALERLGFAGAEETAVGATLVKREYEKQIQNEERDVIISSCCHSVNLLICKYYPALLPYLSPVVSPMLAHSMDLKKRHGAIRTVFIGPCLSKKDEAVDSAVDAVLTFEELSGMLKEQKIVPEQKSAPLEQSRARLFPTVGGILKTMDLPDNGYTYMTVDGTENCKRALDDILAGGIHRCFIEMSACAGSCIGGPVMEKYHDSPIRHYQDVITFAGKEDFAVNAAEKDELRRYHLRLDGEKITPTETQIGEILKQMGKNRPEDELNCGTCGYDTCREKAAAVYRGKADINMCLPFLMDKTERFSNNILMNSLNGVLVVNEELEIQKINRAAMEMLNIQSESDVLGEQVARVFDPYAFIQTMAEEKPVRDRREYYPEYKKYLELSVVHDKTSRILIALLRDVTELTTARRNKEALEKSTMEVADQVVDKQMRIVQEIASLLGETAAETKIALVKLKESMLHEEE